MFVVSVSSKKAKRIALILAAAFIVISAALYISAKIGTGDSSSANAGYNVSAKNSEERLRFISQYGWEVDEEPAEVRDVAIPEEFDDVYTNYNEIQLSQGFDLTEYAGMRVKRWTYIIRNYPEYSAEDDCIRINILIYDGIVIGGDVCSIKLDGFMHGFAKE